jgi:hypothetical protein
MLEFITLLYVLELGFMPKETAYIGKINEIHENVFYTELDAEVRFWDVFFIGGNMVVRMNKIPDTHMFDPYSADFFFRTGFNIGPITLYYEHLCIHPISGQGIGNLRSLRYGGYDKFGLRISNR